MPNEFITQGIVLRAVPYREADKIATILSPTHGKLDFAARGVRKTTAKLRQCVEQFAAGEFTLIPSGARHTVKGFTLAEGFYPLRLDYDRLTTASCVSSLAACFALPSKPDEELYNATLAALHALAYSDANTHHVLSSFIMSLLNGEGLSPTLDDCGVCGKPIDGIAAFANSVGGVCHKECAGTTRERTYLSHETLAYIKELQDTQRYDSGTMPSGTMPSGTIDISPESYAEASRTLLAFAEYQAGTSVKAGKFLT